MASACIRMHADRVPSRILVLKAVFVAYAERTSAFQRVRRSALFCSVLRACALPAPLSVPLALPASDSARDLLSRLLSSDTSKRLTAEEALNHPWLRGDTAPRTALDPLVLKAMRTFDVRQYARSLNSTRMHAHTHVCACQRCLDHPSRRFASRHPSGTR